MLRCIIPEEMSASDMPSALDELRAKGQQLLHGAEVILDFGARPLDSGVVSSILSEFVWPSGVRIVAWITYDAASQDNLKRVGLPTSEPVQAKFSKSRGLKPALVLHRSLRSGQRVEHRGDVVISGHVNDGAEVLSSGHVVILGRLNGLVHAGYEGDEGASVIARSMEALQVRIGGKIGSLERNAQWWGKMVTVRVDEGSVLIDYWPALKAERIEDAV
ncbi:MAG: septum site-determining protein MinC [Synergistaceae bacterium]|nr:septum site-determining protein MinC [Synergistaceae bacterium]